MSEFNFSPSAPHGRGRPPGSRNKPKENFSEQVAQPYNWAFADEKAESTQDVDFSIKNDVEIDAQPELDVSGVSIDFINVLRKVKSDAQNHQQHLAKNEGATRTTLVDPVLRALGWEISNPNSAIVEARARRGPNTIFADYALMAGSSTRFIVEAKALGQDLKSHRNQVVDYAFAFQINNVFLTNGMIWEHYTNLNPKLLAPTKILNLETDKLENIAAYLTQELHATPTTEDENTIAELYEKAENLTAEMETIFSRISTLEIDNERQPLTLTLQSRIAALQASLNVSTFPSLELDLENSPLGSEIIRMMEEKAFYESTPTELMDFINNRALPENKNSDSWPRSIKWFSSTLQGLAPSLKQSGIDLQHGKSGGRRFIKIRRVDSPLLKEVVKFMADKKFYRGSATDLLDIFNAGETQQHDKWPATTSHFSSQLLSLNQRLNQAGIQIRRGRANGKNYVVLTKITDE